jgi:putative chitinase
MSLDITEPLQRFWPNANPALLQGIIDTADDVFAKFQMADNRLRIAHFMAQITAETGGGVEIVENMNYSAEGLMRTWPHRFDADKAERFAHNPEMIGDEVYGGRMGNDQPGDGYRYRGQGLLQTTGKGLYAELSQYVGIDLVANPDALIAPDTALLCAAGDFVCVCKCLPYADQDDLLAVSGCVNDGSPNVSASQVIGWQQRVEAYKQWSEALQS